MVSDLPGALVDGTGIDQLDRIGHAGVQALFARSRAAGKQGLSHKFMSEGERLLGSLRARDDHPHLLRLLDYGEKFVNIDLAYLGQESKAETAPDHRCCGQHPLVILVEPLQTAADDQPHVFRDIALIDRDVRADLAGRIKDFPLLYQMPVELLDEKWVPLALLEDGVHQTLRSLALT